MSFNQSKSDRSESSYSRKPGRSGNSSNQRSSYSSGGGVKGGGSTAPPPPSSINSSSNRRYKNSGSGQPRVNATSPIFESNVSVARAVQNGAHAQPPLPGVAAKPTSSSIPRSPQPIPRPPSKQPPVEPATPIKGDESKGFPLQFGTISPGFMNGMQIPARTSSAPPNLDEQKRDQARHVSSRAVPTMPIPPNTKQQQPRKDASHINRSNTGESHAPSQSKRDVHPQIPSAPNTTTMTQKAHVLPITGMSVPPMPFQPQIPIPYGGPNPQIQSQGITSTSLQVPISLPVGNAAQVQHQMFVQSLPPHHPLQQAMMPQAQNLNFAPQMGHQHQLAPPQLGNMGIGIGSQFTQQQAAKFGAPRKAVKITHPETHEELRLDKRIDPYSDGSRSHPNVTPQSQPIQSYAPTHQISYFSHIQPSTYNQTPIFFQAQTTPLTSTQMTANPQPPRYNYSVSHGPQNLSVMNPSTLNPLQVTKSGPPMHGVADGEKVGSSTVTVSAPVASKGDSPKLLRPPQEARIFHPQKDSEIGSEKTFQLSKSVSESSGSISLSLMDKHSVSSAAPAVPSEESASVVNNADGKRRDNIRRSDSLKEHQKKPSRKDLQQEATSDSGGRSKSPSSLKMAGEVAKHPEKMVGSSMSISSSPSQVSEHSSSVKDGNSEVVESEAVSSSSESCGGVLESVGKPLPDNCVDPDASEVESRSSQIGEISTCEPLNKSDIELVEAVSDNLDTACLPEVQPKQEIMETVEQGKIDLSEGSIQEGSDSEIHLGSISLKSLEGNKQIQQDSIVKEMTVGSVPGSMETEQETNEAMGCCSVDSIDAETTSSSVVSLSTVDTSMDGNEQTDGQDASVLESSLPHQDSAPLPSPVSSETSWKLEGKGGISGSKDKPTLEIYKVKSTNAKVGKKKRKDILKAADAAGSTSDLYMAYKGPEEKQDVVVSFENIDSSSSVDVKQAIGDDAEKVVVASEEDEQIKTEPDDWEVAADGSTPELKTSDNLDEGGSEISGRNKYSRDFLLTLAERCTDLPESFRVGSDIAGALMIFPIGMPHLIDNESYPNVGRNIDNRPSAGPRLDRRVSGMVDEDKWSKSSGVFASGWDPRMDAGGHGHGGAVVGFRPGQGGNHGILRNTRGPPSGIYGGGILSGPMQSLTSQGGIQRNGSDADRWQRATGFQKGLIPSPQSHLLVMHKAEKKYERGKVSDEEEAKQRKLKAILNKLTPQNFDKLFDQVKEVKIDNVMTLTGVISQIFDKALTEPTFCEMYANFCSHLAAELPDFNDGDKKITFKIVLLNKCQEEFERGEIEEAEANRIEEEDEIKKSETEEKKIKARRRMLGNIRLIGELYKKKMLTERIMHGCINKLLGQYENPDEEDVEALCKLMSTIGELIDHPKAKEHMDGYFDNMSRMSNNTKLSTRVRFMLRDSIDLRKNKWQQRRKVEGPKKIDEVHRDAAQERQAQATRLARGPIVNSSVRRGQPMDFSPRGSNVFSSTNAQMGGLRGLPQVRGYAPVQDVRLDDRHRYESRTLSVPLSQRPVDNDSITLGPQGGLARGMSIKGPPLMSGVPLVEMSPSPGDSRRLPTGPNGYNSTSDWIPNNSREEPGPSNSHFGNQDLRSTNRPFDRSTTVSPTTRVQGSSTVALAHNVASEKVWPEERLRDKSVAAIREYYSAQDEQEVVLCIKDLNSPSFYPSMISIWVTDSFERKDMDRDLLAKLLINLTKSQDSLLSQVQLIKGIESVLATLEDAVNDAPKATEFLGRILAKIILENVVTLREIGLLIREGGEEPGRLKQIGFASDVLGSIFEIIRSENGESVLNEIRSSSNLRLEDFRPPDASRSRKLEAFI